MHLLSPAIYKIISFYRLAMIHRKINAKVIKEECNRFHSLKKFFQEPFVHNFPRIRESLMTEIGVDNRLLIACHLIIRRKLS